MPTAVPTACLQPRCPHPAERKGYCAIHRRANDGYSPTWRARSMAARRAQPVCQRCGGTTDLTTDHIIPGSLGGTDDWSNLRVLCRSCHASIGRTRSRPGNSEPTDPVEPSEPHAERDRLRIVG